MNKIYIITNDNINDLNKCIRELTINTINQCQKMYNESINKGLNYNNILDSMKYSYDQDILENITILKSEKVNNNAYNN